MKMRDVLIEQRSGKEPDPYAQSLRYLPEDITGVQGTLRELRIFPGKALGELVVDRAVVTGYGLRTTDGLQDRSFMLGIKNKRAKGPEDPEYTRFSQREEPKLALVTPEWDGSRLIYDAPGMDDLRISRDELAPRSDTPMLVEVIPGENILAVPENGPITARIRQFLSQFRTDIDDIQVFLRSTEHERNVVARHSMGESAETFFSDGGQNLLASRNSLSFVNNQMYTRQRKKDVPLEGKISMQAIRPNMEIVNWPQNIEDVIAAVRIQTERGDVRMRFGDLCIRCSVTMVNNQTGERRKDGEPIDTFLASRPRRLDDEKKPTFAVNTVFPKDEWGKTISVGDKVVVESEKEVEG